MEEGGGTRVDQVNTTNSTDGDHPLTDNGGVDDMGGKVDINGDGVVDRAARFYAANNPHEYLSRPFDADMHFSQAQSFTLAFWARPAFNDYRGLVGTNKYGIVADPMVVEPAEGHVAVSLPLGSAKNGKPNSRSYCLPAVVLIGLPSALLPVDGAFGASCSCVYTVMCW